MATGATIHTFTVQLADVDRSVYEDFTLRVARHPSETDSYMVTRLLAYCLEYEEGIAFSERVRTTPGSPNCPPTFCCSTSSLGGPPARQAPSSSATFSRQGPS